jgi:DNA-binding IclR family transcriptional regulator
VIEERSRDTLLEQGKQVRRGRPKGLAQATFVLEFLGRSGPSTLSDVARGLEIPLSTAHRILGSLVDEGWLTQLADKRYVPSPAMWEAGILSLQHLHPHFVELLSEFAQRIAADLDEAASVAVPFGTETLYVGRVSRPNPLPLYAPVALRWPVHCSASGKVMLAFEDDEAFEAVCAEGLTQVTSNTIASPEALRAELIEARRTAVAFNRGEMNVDRRGVAVPVLTSDGRGAAALGCSLPADRFTEAWVANAVHVMHGYASHLSLVLGYRGSAFDRDRFA